MAAMQDREFDAIVFGCTGDTGSLGCCWLYFHGKSLGITKWAPAARNLEKVKTEVVDKFAKVEPGDDGVAASEPIKADSGDYESVVAMCKRTRLVLACAGPYEKFGEAVIRACCEVGTNYVDVTGEYHWVAQMEAKYGKQALEKNITLVSCAGYDSIPPDLTTWLAATAFKEKGDKIKRYDAFVGAGGGAMPSGTIETLLGWIAGFKASCCRCLCCGLCSPKVEAPKQVDVETPLNDEPKAQYVPAAEQQNLSNNAYWNLWPSWSSLGGRCSVLHFMAPININIVHRTAAQEGYGGLVYRERLAVASGICSCCGILPTILFMIFVFIILFLIILPGGETCVTKCLFGSNPGAIASVKRKMFDACQSTGSVSVRGYGISEGGKRVEVQMDSNYDAGLGFTMLSSTTIAGLIIQRGKGGEPVRPGFQTGVRCLGGNSLLEGLKKMGCEFAVKMD